MSFHTGSHHAIYRDAALYDLAFSYRDYDAEVAFLARVFSRHARRPLVSFLEVAAGPGRHALSMARRGTRAAALDLAPEMLALGARLAAEQGLAVEGIAGDMRCFELAAPVDCAASMLCSASYLVSDTALDCHLDCMARAVAPGGLYILELAYPESPKTQSQWQVPLPDACGHLDVAWEGERPRLVGSAAFARTTATLALVLDGREVRRVSCAADQRIFTRDDWAARTQPDSPFELVDVFGALDENVALHDPHAWRMVIALRRKAASPS